MRAIVMNGFGGPEVLAIGEVPEPESRAGDLIVRVRAAGVNRAEINQRKGAYGDETFGDSPLLGLEIAGEVVAVADDVDGFAVGDRVMGIVGGGAYAEFARIPAAMAMPIPPALTFAEAAAVPEAYVTAHNALFHLGRLQPDETVMVHGGASGVGIAIVMLAAHAGARVLFTARPSAIDRVIEQGGALGCDYAEDFLPFVTNATAGRGVDLIIDTIGTPNFDRNIQSLAPGGRLVQLGLMGGRAPASLPLDQLLFKRLSIIGSVMKTLSSSEKQQMTSRFAEAWLPLFDQGRIRPVIHTTFALEDAAAAHALMEAGGHIGKIVLLP